MTMQQAVMNISNKIHNNAVDLGKIIEENKDIIDVDVSIMTIEKAYNCLKEAEELIDSIF